MTAWGLGAGVLNATVAVSRDMMLGALLGTILYPITVRFLDWWRGRGR